MDLIDIYKTIKPLIGQAGIELLSVDQSYTMHRYIIYAKVSHVVPLLMPLNLPDRHGEPCFFS